jgi:hypothetical protein
MVAVGPPSTAYRKNAAHDVHRHEEDDADGADAVEQPGPHGLAAAIAERPEKVDASEFAHEVPLCVR